MKYLVTVLFLLIFSVGFSQDDPSDADFKLRCSAGHEEGLC